MKLPPEAYQPLRRAAIAETMRKAAELKMGEGGRCGRGAGGTLGWSARAAFSGPCARPAEKAAAAAKAELAAVEAAIKDPDQGPARAPRRGEVGRVEPRLEPASQAVPDTSTGRRSALANWITDATNPLTARVAVNHSGCATSASRWWPTVFDFGRKGTPPTHPDCSTGWRSS